MHCTSAIIENTRDHQIFEYQSQLNTDVPVRTQLSASRIAWPLSTYDVPTLYFLMMSQLPCASVSPLSLLGLPPIRNGVVCFPFKKVPGLAYSQVPVNRVYIHLRHRPPVAINSRRSAGEGL